MKKLLLAAALAVAFAGHAGAAEVTMPIDVVGDWCLVGQEGGETQYQLPSWRLQHDTCEHILSINKYGFYHDDRGLNCDAVTVSVGKYVAHTGIGGTVKLRCQPNGVVTATSGKLMTFKFWRYKGNMEVTFN